MTETVGERRDIIGPTDTRLAGAVMDDGGQLYSDNLAVWMWPPLRIDSDLLLLVLVPANLIFQALLCHIDVLSYNPVMFNYIKANLYFIYRWFELMMSAVLTVQANANTLTFGVPQNRSTPTVISRQTVALLTFTYVIMNRRNIIGPSLQNRTFKWKFSESSIVDSDFPEPNLLLQQLCRPSLTPRLKAAVDVVLQGRHL